VPRISPPARALDAAVALTACVLVLFALAIIWEARLSIGRDVYVSVMGAQGMPTAGLFQVALVMVSVGGAMIAFAARGIRVAPRILNRWRPSVSLAFASAFFFLASQVTCTPGCPLPYGPLFTWPDFVHTSSAVLAFAFACWAMVQLTCAPGRRMMAALSLCCGVAVALIAGAGGIMSLLDWEPGLGSRFEFAAATIAILWLVSLGAVIAVPRSPRRVSPPGTVPSRRRVRALRPALNRAASGASRKRPRAGAGGLSAPQ
jgi:hypothetical protein